MFRPGAKKKKKKYVHGECWITKTSIITSTNQFRVFYLKKGVFIETYHVWHLLAPDHEKKRVYNQKKKPLRRKYSSHLRHLFRGQNLHFLVSKSVLHDGKHKGNIFYAKYMPFPRIILKRKIIQFRKKRRVVMWSIVWVYYFQVLKIGPLA